MSNASRIMASSYRGADVAIMRWAERFMIMYILMQVTALLRLIGFPDIQWVVLFTYRFMDLILISVFFLFWRKEIRARSVDMLMLFVAIYPAIVGVIRGQVNVTYFNDIAIFFAFILKVIIFRSLITSISSRYDFEKYIAIFLKKFVLISVIVATILFVVAQILVSSGQLLYYQSPAEITLATGAAIASGNVLLIVYFLLFALASGKRMIFVGVFVMLIFGLFTSRKIRFIFMQWMPFLLLLVAIGFGVVIFIADVDGLAFVAKIEGTYHILQRALDNSNNFEVFLLNVEPGRYIEFVSLADKIEGFGLLIGNGYGFRYELNQFLLAEFSYEVLDEDVTNAHFTPIAIAGKFGLLGLLAWTAYLFSALGSIKQKSLNSKFQYACQLALLGYLIQALFAFGLFINLITPFVYAASTIQFNRLNSNISSNRNRLA